MKRLVLLGGGHAHVHVLQQLAALRVPGAEVVLVSPFPRQMYSGMVPGLVAGHYTVDDCVIALRPLADAAGVRWIEGEAVALDAARRQLVLADGTTLDYDGLSLDVGSVMPRDLLPGAREHALFVRPIEHFVALLPSLWALAERQSLDLVVVGGGAAGVELVLAIEHRLNGQAGGAHRFTLVTGGAPPLAGYPPRVMARALAVLKRQRIAVLPQAAEAVAADHVLLAGGARVACQAPILAVGGTAPAWLATSGLAVTATGHVRIGATLQSVSHPEVFAAGDVSARDDVAHPRSGVYAVRAGPPLAANLRAWVAGGALLPHRPPQRTLNLVSCGQREAIAAWGPLAAQGGWVWHWKDRIDRGFIARYRSPLGADVGAVVPRP